ncbi:MAG: PepSY domain-containing protein [Nitratireductor sp.]|nr:PepSY domain-containing protein [Nitratireductor sp.]
MKTVPGTFLAALLAALLLCGVALADDDDHERARQALESGKAKPLSQVLEAVSARIDGEVVGVEFDNEDGRYVYELKIITPSGHLREMHVDALTARIIEHGDD